MPHIDSFKPAQKLIPLESLRGIAAFIVFLGHFMQGFLPQRYGVDSSAIVGGNLQETPFFIFFNGSGWVTFFFVLSGFVLSYRFFQTRDLAKLPGAVIKRWPRLFPIALISTVFSYLMISWGWYTHVEAAAVTGSSWMERLASSSRGGVFDVDFGEAFSQGFYLTFFRGDYYLNSSLWTMHYEFIGSLLVFAIIPFLNGRNIRLAIPLLLLAVAVILFSPVRGFVSAYLIAFTLGCFYSYYHCQVRPRSSLKASAAPSCFWLIPGGLFVFFALGYLEPAKGFYLFMAEVLPDYAQNVRIVLHTLASLILIEMVLRFPKFYALLDGRLGRFLGRCSFSLYVIHVPLMFSVSTGVFLALIVPLGYMWSLFVSFIVTVPILLYVSWLMSLIDERWCRKVNSVIKRRA